MPACFPEQFPHPSHLPRLARVRGARERQLLARETEPLRRTVRHERERLERLRRRAPERHELGVARPRDEAAGRIHDGDVDLMNRFDPTPAELLNAHDRSPLPATYRSRST